VVSGPQANAAWHFTVAALDIKAHDSAAHVRVTVSFNADGYEPWTTRA